MNRAGNPEGVVEVLNMKTDFGFAPADLRVLEQAAEIVQDLVDSVFLGQKVYGATEDVIDAGRQTAVGVVGLILLGAMLTLLLMAAWSAMPIINEALSPSLAPFLPDAKP